MKTLISLLFVFSTMTHASNQIIPVSEGLTLGHIQIEGEDHTLAITQQRGGYVEGVDVSALSGQLLPPIALYQQLGYRRIRLMVENATLSQLRQYQSDALLSPAGSGSHHLAMGLNYALHADEVDASHEPFLFLKLTEPTRQQAIRYHNDRLLDYEVELCARPLETITQATIDNARFAFFLCGDFTDRADLVRHIDQDKLQSGKGFSRSKSLPGYFPTGPYLVIPKQQQRFIDSIQLTTTLNGEVKQSASGQLMIWDLRKMLSELFQHIDRDRPTYSAASRWLPTEGLSPAVSLLTGTPSGVLMRPPGRWFKVRMGSWYFVSLQLLRSDVDVRSYVIERYLQQQFTEQRFIQAGDKVVLTASYLGSIEVDIE